MTAKKTEKTKSVHDRTCACGASYRTKPKRGRPFTRCPKCRKG